MCSILLNRRGPLKLKGASGHDDGGSVVCVVFDINPSSWKHCFGGSSAAEYERTIDSICLFVRAMLLSHWPVSLDFTVMCTAPGAPFLYRSQNPSASTPSGSVSIDQLPSNIGLQIRGALMRASPEPGKQCSVTGALSRALCYVLRRRKAFVNAMARRSSGSVDARIICIHLDDTDNYTEYIPFMNCVFAAQKEQILIDSVALTSRPHVAGAPAPVPAPAASSSSVVESAAEPIPSLLSQASRMTNGLFTTSTPADLLELLLCNFHTGVRGRDQLNLPDDKSTTAGDSDDSNRERGTTAAICFCHRRRITRGFVCSVCLTVLCAFKSLCPTCGSRFTLAALPVTKPPPSAVQYPDLPPPPTLEELEEERRRQEEQQRLERAHRGVASDETWNYLDED